MSAEIPADPPADSSRVTELLRATASAQGTDELFPLLYAELRRAAARLLDDERTDHTLQPTALVHEAWVRLVDIDALAAEDSDTSRFGAGWAPSVAFAFFMAPGVRALATRP